MIKGFTMIESLFCFSMILIMVTISMPVFHHIDLDYSFKEVLNIYEVQTNAMVNKETEEYQEEVTFNRFGDINHATTIEHDYYDLIFQLGNGRFYVR